MARFSPEARALAGLAAVSLLAAACTASTEGKTTDPSHPRAGVIKIFAGYNGETQTIPSGKRRHVLVTFTPKERRLELSGKGTVEDQLTGTGYAIAITPRSGLRQKVRLPNSAQEVTAKVIIRA